MPSSVRQLLRFVFVSSLFAVFWLALLPAPDVVKLVSWQDKIEHALVPAAIAIGFAVNVLRILIISTTARYFPGHYDALHEIVGTIALWGGLGLVGWLAWRPKMEPAAAAADEPKTARTNAE